ncbi:MAG: TonB-dependent receptor [Caulobacterales bacterium]
MNKPVARQAAVFGWGLTSALMASTMLASTPARAAEAEAESVTQVGELVVTAEKREENIQTIPMSVQAIDTKHLEQLNVTDFGDYVKFMPSVSFQTTGPNQTSIYMRGISSGDNANHSGPLPSVGTYLDEQPTTTIGGTLDVHIYDIARIEVLPGPQGTLYGASSESGTLRIITNQPSLAGFSAAYDVQGAYVDHGQGKYVAEGYVNVPVAKNAAIRLVGWVEHDPGFIANVPGTRTFINTSGVTFNNAAFVNRYSNPEDTVGARAALRIDLDDNWTLTPTVLMQDQRSSGSPGYLPSIGDLQVNRFQPDNDHDRFIQAALTLTGKIGNYELTYSGGYFWRGLDQKTDYTDYSIFYDAVFGSAHYWLDNSGSPFNAPFASPLPTPLQEIVGRDRFDKESNELRIASPATDRFRFIAGLFQERQTHWIIQDYQIQGFNTQLSVPNWPNTIWLTNQYRADRDEALFGEASFDFTPQLTLTAGIRGYWYDNTLFGFFGFSQGYDKLTGFSSGMGNNGQFCQTGKTFKNDPCVDIDKAAVGSGETHKINLNYKIDPDHLVYFTYSTGYRPGGNNRNVVFGQYAADTLSNYEIGWKTSWFDRKLIFDGSIFYEEWNNFQFSFLGQNSLTIIQNAPQASSKGIEASADLRPNDHLTISAGAAYTDATLTKNFCGADPITGVIIKTCADSTAVALHGQQLPYTPKFKGDLTARYAFDVMDWKAHVQGSLVYQTMNFVGLRTNDNALLGTIPAYATADFDAGAERDKFRVDLFIKNAFDARGQVNRFTPCTVSVCAANIPALPKAVYVIPTEPLTVGIKFGESF